MTKLGLRRYPPPQGNTQTHRGEINHFRLLVGGAWLDNASCGKLLDAIRQRKKETEYKLD